MNIVEPIGHRERLSWNEVADILKISKARLQSMVYKSNTLPKRYQGEFPFAREDVTDFLNAFNAGRVHIGRGRRNAS
jgi:hypothetical protein